MAVKRVGARKAPAKLSREAHGIASGYRSGLEERIAKELTEAGHDPAFESIRLPFEQPVKQRTYTPDFPLWNGIVVETKGYFKPEDRVKHLIIQKQYPDLDIRFVFERSKTKLPKPSKTTYAAWCEKHGFLYADTSIPPEWLNEPPEERRVKALRAIAVPVKK